MAWYYKDAGANTAGPVDKAELQRLIKAGQINGRTLVRSDTMADWKPLSEMVHSKSATGQAPAPHRKKIPSRQAPDPFPTTGHLRLSRQLRYAPMRTLCPTDQVVTYDDQVICAACKPIVVQKLKEGVGIRGAFAYAGF